jgi:predicted dithiol-disulfide oxidoreductase (DUF899 family)
VSKVLGTREEWLAARVALLEEEKELTRRSDELHGLSTFALEDGIVYHTYSCYDRVTDVLSATWQLLDRTSKGRGDDPEGWPHRHDEYE